MITSIIIVCSAIIFYSFGGWFVAAIAALILGLLPPSDRFFLPIVLMTAIAMPMLLYDLAVNHILGFPAPGTNMEVAAMKQKSLLAGTLIVISGMIKSFRFFR